MPIVDQIRTKEGLILNWRIEEPLLDLEKTAQLAGIALADQSINEKRKQQYYIIQLLHAQLHPGLKLHYAKTGKPFISDSIHVSISHSGEHVVMMTSSIACGVDIEKVGHKVTRIRHKFLNPDEMKNTQTASELELTKYWSAKEAIYKVCGSNSVFLKSNIFVEPVAEEHWRGTLQQNGVTKFTRTIRFKHIENMVLAWTEQQDEV